MGFGIAEIRARHRAKGVIITRYRAGEVATDLEDRPRPFAALCAARCGDLRQVAPLRAVRDLDSAQTHSFSIRLIAERKHVSFEKIEDDYDGLERQMLDEFFEFVSQRKKHTWLHWNMRDTNYGFPAIEHRYQVLDGSPETIPDGFKVDLAHVLPDIFGPNYAPYEDSGRLMSLTNINDLTTRDALSGAKEAEAFQRKDYVALHQSTLRKVDILANLATRAFEGTLKTNASWWEIKGGSLRGLVEFLKDHTIMTVVGLAAAIITIVRSCACS